MILVAYSDSEDDEPPAKKPRNELPALPSTFRDLYSSTVRSSTHDDPALHGGRKRVVPHREGNWPAHVYLEWLPDDSEQDVLESVLKHSSCGAQSLLRNDLGVPLALHISLSRPLVLKVEQKETYLLSLQEAVRSYKFESIRRTPAQLRWHLNEDGSRDFLVLQLGNPAQDDALDMLLQSCNRVAEKYDQPLLYATGPDEQARDQFHISIGWRLPTAEASTSQRQGIELPQGLDNRLASMTLAFTETKVRIGQDVTTIPFQQSRDGSRSLFA